MYADGVSASQTSTQIFVETKKIQVKYQRERHQQVLLPTSTIVTVQKLSQHSGKHNVQEADGTSDIRGLIGHPKNVTQNCIATRAIHLT
jgi:hypothetical protein